MSLPSGAAPRRPRIAQPAFAALLLLILRCDAGLAGAPWTDPVPWRLLDEAPMLGFVADRMDDGDSGWRVDRIGLTGSRPVGASGRMFARWRFLSFSRAGVSPLDRWPELAGADAGAGWPDEDRGAGWSRPELGLLSSGRLPLAGRIDYAVHGCVPFARNDLYPFAERSVSYGLSFRKSLLAGAGWRLSMAGGRIWHLGAAGDDLDDSAFMTVTDWELGLSAPLGEQGRLGLAWRGGAGDGYRSRRVDLTLIWPLGDEQALGLGFEIETASEDDRYFARRAYLAVTVPLVPSEEDGGGKPGPQPRGR